MLALESAAKLRDRWPLSHLNALYVCMRILISQQRIKKITVAQRTKIVRLSCMIQHSLMALTDIKSQN